MTRLYLEDFAVGQKYGTTRLRVDAEAIKAFLVQAREAAPAWPHPAIILQHEQRGQRARSTALAARTAAGKGGRTDLHGARGSHRRLVRGRRSPRGALRPPASFGVFGPARPRPRHRVDAEGECGAKLRSPRRERRRRRDADSLPGRTPVRRPAPLGPGGPATTPRQRGDA